jgi:hypothetical protein
VTATAAAPSTSGAAASASETERVRCLECGTVYSKPHGRGTLRANPGCPHCGYLGWLAASVPFSPADAPTRFVLGRPRPQST